MAVALTHVLRHLPSPWFHPGYLAVDFFFVLSGLVLARSYEARFEKGLTFGAYMARRILRLYPAILAGLAFGLAVALAHGATDQVWIAAALQAMMLPRLAGPVFPLNEVQWSLLFELFANALHALIHRWLTNTRLALLIGASAIVLWSLSIWRGEMSGGFTFDSFDRGFARVIFSFFVGVAIHRITLRPAAHRLSLSFLPAAVICGLVLAVPVQLVMPMIVWELAATTFIWPALVYLVMRAPQPVRLSSFADWSGRLSYPLYAVHFPLVTLAAAWLPANAPLALAVIIASLVAAALVERFIERPVLAWKGRARTVAVTP